MKVSQEMSVTQRLNVLLTALRDGSYEQRSGALKVTDDSGQVKGFCCEGVACDLTVGLLGEWIVSESGHNEFLGVPSYAPDAVNQFFGMDTGSDWTGGTTKWVIHEPEVSEIDGSVMWWRDVFPAYLNDNGLSFHEIADKLETYYLKGGKEEYEAWKALQDS